MLIRKLALLLLALGAPVVREKEKGFIHNDCPQSSSLAPLMSELRRSMNSGLTELLALLCFSLFSY
jgi:hypothetical protein